LWIPRWMVHMEMMVGLGGIQVHPLWMDAMEEVVQVGSLWMQPMKMHGI
jgi:hypothetical protein